MMNSTSSNEPILAGFGFARARDKAFASIRDLWKIRRAQGMTQADVAARLGKDPAWVSRKLSGPSNWTLRTFGDLADALDGEVYIRLADLKSGEVPANFDAYLGYGDADMQSMNNRNQSGQSGGGNQLPLAA